MQRCLCLILFKMSILASFVLSLRLYNERGALSCSVIPTTMADKLYRRPSQVGDLPPRERLQRTSKSKSIASLHTDQDEESLNANSDTSSESGDEGSVQDEVAEHMFDVEKILDSDWEGMNKVCFILRRAYPIVDSRSFQGMYSYQVKWLDSTEISWEPASGLRSAILHPSKLRI